MKDREKTEIRILHAAAKLFDTQGYKGTSVRQIAGEAEVNVALISYHFQGKQGVLEMLIANYYETFFGLLAKEEENFANDVFERVIRIVRLYVYYQREHAAVTRLIQRELSVETMLAREVMTLYIHRWKHSFASIIEEGIHQGYFRSVPLDQVLLSMTSLLIYPYLNPQSVREVYYLEPNTAEFCEWLVSSTEQLLRALLMPNDESF